MPRQQSLSLKQQWYKVPEQARETQSEIVVVSLAATSSELAELEKSVVLVNAAGSLPVDEGISRIVEVTLILLSIIREGRGALEEKGCIRSTPTRRREWRSRPQQHSTAVVAEGVILGG